MISVIQRVIIRRVTMLFVQAKPLANLRQGTDGTLCANSRNSKAPSPISWHWLVLSRESNLAPLQPSARVDLETCLFLTRLLHVQLLLEVVGSTAASSWCTTNTAVWPDSRKNVAQPPPPSGHHEHTSKHINITPRHSRSGFIP